MPFTYYELATIAQLFLPVSIKAMAKAFFAEKVFSLCRKIPPGKVATYKEIARALGMKGNGSRAVGQALRCSPGMPAVPCHRVVRSDGSVGGFKGKMVGKEIKEKIKLLEKEGIGIAEGRINLGKFFHKL